MKVTIELTDAEVAFLNKLIKETSGYENLDGLEAAVKECIRIAMYDESEPMAADEGV